MIDTKLKINNTNRPSKELYYLGIARAVSVRSTCLRRRYGAVIVQDDVIVSTGYNGSPRNTDNCTDENFCLREKQNIKSGQNYELCKAVHAEANAIIAAPLDRMKNAVLYLYGFEVSSNSDKLDTSPCVMCERMIINAGISRVIIPDSSLESGFKIIEKSSFKVFEK